MPKEKGSTPPVLEVPQGQKVILAGQPDNMHGRFISIPAPEPDSPFLPISTLDSTLAAARSKQKAAGITPSLRIRPGIIRPGMNRPVSVSLSLDPYTPPGEYQAEVDVAGQPQAVVILVTEKVSLRVSPSELVIENLPGQKVSKQVVFSTKATFLCALVNLAPFTWMMSF
jgi:hypothetical protein